MRLSARSFQTSSPCPEEFLLCRLMFFFYCYGDHRDLHSFPTRRSSDLDPDVVPVPVRGHVAGPRVRELVHDQLVDRKSTRLNSSHSQISYAVFCLKKKKNH